MTDTLFVKVMLLLTKLNSKTSKIFLGQTVSGGFPSSSETHNFPTLLPYGLPFMAADCSYLHSDWEHTDDVAAVWVVLQYYKERIHAASRVVTFSSFQPHLFSHLLHTWSLLSTAPMQPRGRIQN